MKIVLIIGIIVVSILGFLMFLMYISKQQTQKPIEKVKEKDKNEALFIKERQEEYKKNHTNNNVQKVTPLSEENRGLLFEKAIQRKQNNFKDDDEYKARLLKKKLEVQRTEPQEDESQIQKIEGDLTEEFVPKQIPLSSFKEDEQDKKIEDKEIKQPEDTSKEKEEIEEQVEKESEVVQEKKVENLYPDRVYRVNPPSLEERKSDIAKIETETRMAIQRFREEVLLEAENIKKRREELAMASNGLS